MLKIVLTPISRRTGATFFIALWWLGANMKPTPVAWMHSATCSGVRARLTPSASSTSAAPDLLDTLRPPCLATRAPAAAATKIVAVEMLKVCAPSPPVPTTSRKLPGSPGTTTLLESSRITVAAAAISPMVSFLVRRPDSSAAVINGEISPAMIWRISDSISSKKISRCSITRCSAAWGVMLMRESPYGRPASSFAGSGKDATRSGRDRLLEEVPEQGMTMLGQDRFRVELHAFDRQFPVAQAHDLAVFGPRGDLEAFG